MLWSKPRLSIEFIEAKIKEWAASDITEAADDNGNAEEREQPWKKEQPFRREDVKGKFSLVLSNGIYIDSLNLKAALQNQIRRLAAIRNPIFIKMRQSVCRTCYRSVDISGKGSSERVY